MFNFLLFLTDETTSNEITKSIDWSNVLDVILNWCKTTGIHLIIAIIVLILGFKIINFVVKKIEKRLQKKSVDTTIAKVSISFIKISLKVLLVITMVGYVGIETASLSAVVLSLGTGISLAVQGTLSNFAGGVIIIVMRPFKIGDFITSNGQSGTVEDIKLFYTHIVTTDNKAVMIPNGTLANNVIVNASAKETRRCDVTIRVSYGTNCDLAIELIKSVISKNETIFSEPQPFVKLGELSESSIQIYVRVWCKNKDYWNTYYYLLNEIMNTFSENNIEIPFKQLDVHVRND